MQNDHNASPLNPLPPVVWLIVLPFIALEIVLQAGELGIAGGPSGIGWRSDALQRMALAPMMLGQMWQTGQWVPDFLRRFVTYAFVNASFTQTVMVVVFILALGKMVAEVFRAWAVIAIFLTAAIVGGVVYSLIPGVEIALYGGFPAVYGLIGAFTFILWARLGALNANRYRAFTLIGMLLSVQLVFSLLFGGNPVWIAEVTGFVTGFALSFLVAPGGPSHVLRMIRQR